MCVCFSKRNAFTEIEALIGQRQARQSRMQIASEELSHRSITYALWAYVRILSIIGARFGADYRGASQLGDGGRGRDFTSRRSLGR